MCSQKRRSPHFSLTLKATPLATYLRSFIIFCYNTTKNELAKIIIDRQGTGHGPEFFFPELFFSEIFYPEKFFPENFFLSKKMPNFLIFLKILTMWDSVVSGYLYSGSLYHTAQKLRIFVPRGFNLETIVKIHFFGSIFVEKNFREKFVGKNFRRKISVKKNFWKKNYRGRDRPPGPGGRSQSPQQ